eukprot:scaffold164026_cov31-Tisochrysis_lutea.AAC.3
MLHNQSVAHGLDGMMPDAPSPHADITRPVVVLVLRTPPLSIPIPLAEPAARAQRRRVSEEVASETGLDRPEPPSRVLPPCGSHQRTSEISRSCEDPSRCDDRLKSTHPARDISCIRWGAKQDITLKDRVDANAKHLRAGSARDRGDSQIRHVGQLDPPPGASKGRERLGVARLKEVEMIMSEDGQALRPPILRRESQLPRALDHQHSVQREDVHAGRAQTYAPTAANSLLKVKSLVDLSWKRGGGVAIRADAVVAVCHLVDNIVMYAHLRMACRATLLKNTTEDSGLTHTTFQVMLPHYRLSPLLPFPPTP